MLTKKKKKKSTSDHTLHTSSGERLKRSIIKTRNVIRKKFHDLHNKKLAVNEQVSETYKPIIEPLESLVKHEKFKQEKQQNALNFTFPEVGKKEEMEKEYMFLPDSVFKTAVAPHRANPFQYTTKSSSSSISKSKMRDISGVSPLDDDDDDDNEEEASRHVDSIIRQVQTSPNIDTTYGFKYSNGVLRLGKDVVLTKSTPNGIVYSVRKKDFAVTSGLTDLLLSNNPKKYTKDDLVTYKDMLTYTSAHKTNSNARSEILRNESHPKYRSIISKLFPDRTKALRSSGKKGGSLIKKPQTKFKLVTENASDYIYWDDPNELVDRLRLLMASQAAGHTGHDNEIISIIEELREAKIIK